MKPRRTRGRREKNDEHAVRPVPIEGEGRGLRAAVKARWPRQRTGIWMDQGEMQRAFSRQEAEPEADLFPFCLFPPIVAGQRFESRDAEREVEALVTEDGGKFAGTQGTKVPKFTPKARLQ